MRRKQRIAYITGDGREKDVSSGMTNMMKNYVYGLGSVNRRMTRLPLMKRWEGMRMGKVGEELTSTSVNHSPERCSSQRWINASLDKEEYH